MPCGGTRPPALPPLHNAAGANRHPPSQSIELIMHPDEAIKLCNRIQQHAVVTLVVQTVATRSYISLPIVASSRFSCLIRAWNNSTVNTPSCQCQCDMSACPNLTRQRSKTPPNQQHSIETAQQHTIAATAQCSLTVANLQLETIGLYAGHQHEPLLHQACINSITLHGAPRVGLCHWRCHHRIPFGGEHLQANSDANV